MQSGGRRGRRRDEKWRRTTTRGPTFMCGCACVDGSPSGHLSKLERYREDEHGLCVRMQAHNIEGREIRTPNLLIWSQTRCRCAIPPWKRSVEKFIRDSLQCPAYPRPAAHSETLAGNNSSKLKLFTPNPLWIFCRGKRDLSDGIIEFLKKRIMVSVNMFCPMVRPALS